MTDRELERIFTVGSRDLDARQRARIAQLRGIERDLFKVLAQRIVDALDAGGGRVLTTRGSASIGQLVDAAFNAIDRSGIRAFQKSAIDDLLANIGNNETYFDALRVGVSVIGDKRWQSIQKAVDTTMRKRIGLDKKGRPIKGGYFDDLLKSTTARTAVKQALFNGVTAGMPMNKLLRSIQVIIQGTKQSPGVMQSNFSGLVFDTYQQVDRATSDAYAKKLKVAYLVYQGGLIETSREFCIKKNNKVFTVDEANRDWPKDSTLPRTVKEKASGVLEGYDPLVDMGRWNCRHRVRYISRARAEELRPDLVKPKP
jgi:hypothetical protein